LRAIVKAHHCVLEDKPALVIDLTAGSRIEGDVSIYGNKGSILHRDELAAEREWRRQARNERCACVPDLVAGKVRSCGLLVPEVRVACRVVGVGVRHSALQC